MLADRDSNHDGRDVGHGFALYFPAGQYADVWIGVKEDSMLRLSPIERLRVMERHARDRRMLHEYGRRHREDQRRSIP